MCQVSLGLKRVQLGAYDFKLNKVPLFSRKSVNINVSLSAALKLANRYYCDVNWSYHNVCAKFHLNFKKVQMEAHDFKLHKVPFSALKSVNINVSRSAAPKVALVPASRYNCDLKESNLNVRAKFH